MKEKLVSVMVVDDSEPDQFICKYVLEKHNPNMTVLQAYDGEEALEMLKKSAQKPEIIFLDINMPRLDGHGFLAAYDSVVDKSAVVVMLTSSDQSKDKERSLSYQFVKDYLVKPLDEPLLDVLSRTLD